MFKYRNLLWAGVATLIAASTSLAQVPDSLANTEWSRQFENGSISLRFQDGERVLAIVSGNQGSGTYIQEGSNVTMTFSDGTFRGQVMGQTMNVSAVENTGRKFNFQLTRQENPVVNLGVNPAPQVNNTPQANTNPPANTGPVDAPKDVILQKVKVYDPLAKCDAVTLLVPKGWQKSGGLVWNFQKFSLVDLQLKVNDPKSLRQVEYLPKLAFVTLPQIPGIPNLPTGSYNLGLEVQQRQPVVDPRAFAEQYIVPRFRSGARVTDVKLLPKLAQAHQDGDPTGSVRFVAARVRLEYSVQTQAVEEDVYVVLYAMDPSVSPSVVWGCRDRGCSAFGQGTAGCGFGSARAHGRFAAAGTAMVCRLSAGFPNQPANEAEQPRSRHDS